MIPSGKHKIVVGTSFSEQSHTSSFHALRYSSETSSPKPFTSGRMQVRGKVVEMKVDTPEGETTYLGSVEDHKETDCVLICDNSGKWRLERLHLNLKSLRASDTQRVQRNPVPVSALDTHAASEVRQTTDEFIDENDLFGEDESSDQTPAAASSSSIFPHGHVAADDSDSDSLVDSASDA